MKFVAISDTHGCHRQLKLPEGDVLLHAGDVCDQGNTNQVKEFLEWLDELDYKHKIIIRGNHDFDLKKKTSLLDLTMPSRVTQLENSGIEINGISIWGVPHPLEWGTEKWDSIPLDTQILITHRPPYTILDQPPTSTSIGSKKLLAKVQTIQPRIHLFGHIHASYGQKEIGNTLFLNASSYKASEKRIINRAITFEI